MLMFFSEGRGETIHAGVAPVSPVLHNALPIRVPSVLDRKEPHAIKMAEAEHAEFARLIAPHLDALFRAAYRLTGNRPDAEDLVQDVCVRAFANLRSLESLEHPK